MALEPYVNNRYKFKRIFVTKNYNNEDIALVFLMGIAVAFVTTIVFWLIVAVGLIAS